MKQKIALLTIAVVLIFCAFPQESKAEGFTSAEFLKWPKNKQDSYMSISIGMTAFIASQTDVHKKKASCIDNWYYSDKAKKNTFIRSVMQDNSGYHPQAIILGVIEKQCGEF
ncbi:MAG: hypothetical protein R3D71_08350 [Rickettsiales bacterium]